MTETQIIPREPDTESASPIQQERVQIVRTAIAPRLPRPSNNLAKSMVDTLPSFLPIMPHSVDAYQFQHALIIAANELDPSKVNSVDSVLMCAYACCVTGLQPGKVMGLAYFVPYAGVCQFIPGYKGFVELAHRTGFISSIHADVVYEGEEFEYWTDESGPRLKHRPILAAGRTRGKPMHSYCISQLSDGGRQIRVLTLEELEKAKKASDVWKNHPHEMMMKTSIRRASKLWKMTKELAIAVRLDEQAEADEAQYADGWKRPPLPQPEADANAPKTGTRDERKEEASREPRVTGAQVIAVRDAWVKHSNIVIPTSAEEKSELIEAFKYFVDVSLGYTQPSDRNWLNASAWERQEWVATCLSKCGGAA